MSAGAQLSPIVAAAAALLVVLGALIAFLGSYGLLRLRSFYERVHPPTMGATLGTALVLAASAVLFSALEGRPVLHEIVIAVFMVVATPVTFLILVRAAMHRDGIHRANSARTATSPSREGDERPSSRD